jgi:hypothetical protein
VGKDEIGVTGRDQAGEAQDLHEIRAGRTSSWSMVRSGARGP